VATDWASVRPDETGAKVVEFPPPKTG